MIHFVEHDARLHPHQFALGVDLMEAIEVLGEIDDHRNVAALTGQTGAAAPAGDRRAEFSASGDGRDHVVATVRDHNANWNLPIIRAVGRIQCAVAITEAHLAADCSAKFTLEPGNIDIHLPFHPQLRRGRASSGRAVSHTRDAESRTSRRLRGYWRKVAQPEARK